MDINNFDSFFTNYFSNLQDNDKNSDLENTHHAASIHNNVNTHHITNTDHIANTHDDKKHKNKHEDNRLIIDQLNNSKIVYDSVHLQFIFYFIATCILIGFIFIINMSGNLSIFIIILLLIILFIIFKFLKFNVVNFLMNFKM